MDSNKLLATWSQTQDTLLHHFSASLVEFVWSLETTLATTTFYKRIVLAASWNKNIKIWVVQRTGTAFETWHIGKHYKTTPKF